MNREEKPIYVLGNILIEDQVKAAKKILEEVVIPQNKIYEERKRNNTLRNKKWA